MKLIAFLLLLLTAAFSFGADPFTVILKNGKIMKGQLLSETEELIVFKDTQGIQYSMKKSLLDLEKMKEANTPPSPPPEPVSPEPPIESAVQNPETNSEVTQQVTPVSVEPPVESNQAETLTPTPANPPVEIQPPTEVQPQNPDVPVSVSYYTTLQEGATKVEGVFEEIGSLIDGMITSWEVSASTGRDPVTAFQEYKAGPGATLTASIDAHLQMLQKTTERLNDPPNQYRSAFESINAVIQELMQYYDAVRQYQGKPSISVFRSRINATEQNIQKKIEELKEVKR